MAEQDLAGTQRRLSNVGHTRGVPIATRTFDGPLAYASPLLLLVVAALLVTYREPEGAYAGAGAAQRGGHGH